MRERLLSDENIFLSINLLESYIQNKELLSKADKVLMCDLKDIFNLETIEPTIEKVKNCLEKIIDDEDYYFTINVYFKPKKYENGSSVFRPLHTASLIDQIAMVAMLQILVYDIGDKGQLMPSEISRLIPSNFYGNRFSYNGEQLFKPWQQQYQEYTSIANDNLYNYSETLEYKYEVDLDLENFYPSINPHVLYNYISNNIPLKLNDKDRNTQITIIKKLLYFHLDELQGEELKWYLRPETDDAPSSTAMKTKCTFAKGIPQGLPHSCFFANIYMTIIKEQYSKFFRGEALFYVDDSIIFTNGKDGELNEKVFKEIIVQLNHSIEEVENDLLNDKDKSNERINPKEYNYVPEDFGVKVHDPSKANSKSTYSVINDTKENPVARYLQGICRETSQMGFDMYSAFSDEENEMLQSRIATLLESVEKEIDRLDPNKKEDKSYNEKLIRYRKFFSYRLTILNYKTTGSVEELRKNVLENIDIRSSSEEKDLEGFFNKYTDDILAAEINFVFKKCTDECLDYTDLSEEVENLNKTIYGEDKQHSYIYKANDIYLDNKYKLDYLEVDKYKSLRKAVSEKYRFLRHQSSDNKYIRFENDLNKFYKNNYESLFKELKLDKIYKYSKYMRANNDELERMILNCIFSYIFQYEIDDQFTFAKRSRDSIEYAEVRILSALRNKSFSFEEFYNKYNDFVDEECLQTADYSLLQVIDIFRVFIGKPKRIDDLILIHKYCCDTWKNGSKYLHFYTLHNQEHAVSLIRNSIQLLHAISYIEFKKIDYYILFTACYLHDISMVTLPDTSKFYKENNEIANCIYTNFIEDLDIDNSTNTKKKLCDSYQKIDEFFESNIRRQHAQDSANEIRVHKELDFIDPITREIIAEVSAAHGYDTAGIYLSKSKGRSSLVSEKFIKIILRLSDLLDMSRYRISKIILDHNLENLSSTSRFHWISHLITNGYKLNTEYYLKDKELKDGDSYIRNGSITEKLIIQVETLMSQTTEIANNKCTGVSKSELGIDDDGKVNIKISCEKDNKCKSDKCNFLCKWFTTKNNYLISELAALKKYLNSIPDNYFYSEVEIQVKVVSNTDVSNNAFDYLKEYLE